MSDAFLVERQGAITIINLRPVDELIALDLAETGRLWDVLYDFRASPQRALLFVSAPGHFSPASMDRL